MATMDTYLSSLPVLDPLTRATETRLKPVHLYGNDHLEIDLDEEGRRFIVEACIYRDGMRATGSYDTPSMNAAVKWVKKIPERNKDKVVYGKWTLAGTDFTALVMSHQWPEDKLHFKNREAETLYRFLLARFLVQTKNSIVGADFKINKVVPEMPAEFQDHPELPLADYQKVALHMSIGAEAFAMFMQQGTGKTPIAIQRICVEGVRTRKGMFDKKRMMRVLIVVPKHCRLNWYKEIERFTVVPAKVSVMRGDLFRRNKGVIDAATEEEDCVFSALISSYESVENTWTAINMIPWDLVILDESHYIKNPSTNRFKTMRNLREITERRMLLTGTPITNTPMDLWAQFEFLGDGLSGFMKYKNFRKFYGKYKKSEGTSIERLVGMKNMPLIQERLARLSFSITKKEANLGLPEMVFDQYEVQMGKRQAEYYEKMCTQLALEIEADKASGKKLTADHILTRLMRLAQITSGHIKWDNEYDENGEILVQGAVEQIAEENPKIEAVKYMLEENHLNDPNMKTIIWATFVEDIRILCRQLAKEGFNFTAYHQVCPKEFRARGAEGSSEVFRYDRDCKVFIGNPASAAEGLNLLGYDWEHPDDYTTYCGHEIFFSCNWSPVMRSQAEARAHRRGTRMNVRVTDLTVLGTIDEEIRERVVAKRRMAMAVADVEDILHRVLNINIESDE